MRILTGLWAVATWSALAVAAATPPGAPVLFPEPMSPRNANYAMRVELLPDTHTLKGTATITWRNLTADTVSDAAFHLYLNAFANAQSVFMTESGGRHRSFSFDKEGWGYCRVTALSQRVGGATVPLQPTYPGPDRTVMRTALASPVPPGGEAEFEVAFEDRLPRVFARAGYAGDFHMAGQWFPKLGVYEEGRGWNCHPYHLNSEFYSDFGVYDVEITLPERFVVGATGLVWAERVEGEKKVLSVHAEDVHDFAFTASPDFLVHEEDYEGVKIRVLMQPGNHASVARYAAGARAGLKYFGQWVWKYPYPQITVVDPPRGGEGAGGMEYPMLITGMASPFIPGSLRMPEMVTLHEFGHQYWYGMSANNEFEEAWLDEGINSYYELRIMDAWLGEDRSMMDGFLGLSMGDEAQQRMQYLSVPDLDPVVQPSWEYGGFGAYAAMSYSKPALVLRVLEGVLGTEEMDRVMRAYFERVRFKHPTTQDFLRITSEVAGRDLRPLLEPMLFGTGTVDFKVAEVRNTPREAPEGYDLTVDPPALMEGRTAAKGKASENGEAPSPEPPEGGEKREKAKLAYDCKVTVQRKGELVVPVDIEVTFSDKTTRRERWDGQGRKVTFRYDGPKVTRVVVDPDGKVPLDLQRLNNGWMSRPEGTPATSLSARFQSVFQFLYAALGGLL